MSVLGVEELAITDVETTGLDERTHEIIEVGVAVVNYHTLAVLREDSFKVRPERIELASPEALRINGYNEADWVGALSKRSALVRYDEFIGKARFGGWNSSFDRRFIRALERELGLPLALDHHETDIAALALETLRNVPFEKKTKLDTVAAFFRIDPEPVPHRAINGVHRALEVFRRLRTFEG